MPCDPNGTLRGGITPPDLVLAPAPPPRQPGRGGGGGPEAPRGRVARPRPPQEFPPRLPRGAGGREGTGRREGWGRHSWG